MSKKFKLPKPIGDQTHFTWGPVVKIHSIEALGIDIVEYHPEIVDRHIGTGNYEQTKTQFHPYFLGRDSSQSLQTLPQAVITALTLRRHGWADSQNGRYALFACKLLDLLGETDEIAEEFRVMMEQRIAAKMYAEGYHYRISITENGVPVPPLFIKLESHAGPLMREVYPKGTIDRVQTVKEDGTLEPHSLGKKPRGKIDG